MIDLRTVSGVLGALGIAAAAYGSHGLQKIATSEQLRWWAIAAAIQLVTAPATLLVALNGETVRRWSGWTLVVGVTVFSGSLYAMALGGPRSLGAVTPLGGLALVIGWLGVTLPRRQN